MNEVTLGRTGIRSNKNAFGCLPIQRVSHEYAGMLLKKAYRTGITFFDTARAYSDSEEKMGVAFSNFRSAITIATKTAAITADELWLDLKTSLSLLKTNYIDIYQFHNPAFCPKPEDGTGLYEAMCEAREQKKIRFIGMTNHRHHIAEEAVRSNLYDTLQFPLSYLSANRDLALVRLCKEKNVGFIAMKALSGGLITNSAMAYAWLGQYDNVLPIWGVQREHELDEFISYIKNPPELTEECRLMIKQDRRELAGNFCRGCGYCMPCPVGIEISICARMIPMIHRSPSAQWLSGGWPSKMNQIEDCVGCGQCKSKCPYELNTPELLQANLTGYRDILSGKVPI